MQIVLAEESLALYHDGKKMAKKFVTKKLSSLHVVFPGV